MTRCFLTRNRREDANFIRDIHTYSVYIDIYMPSRTWDLFLVTLTFFFFLPKISFFCRVIRLPHHVRSEPQKKMGAHLPYSLRQLRMTTFPAILGQGRGLRCPVIHKTRSVKDECYGRGSTLFVWNCFWMTGLSLTPQASEVLGCIFGSISLCTQAMGLFIRPAVSFISLYIISFGRGLKLPNRGISEKKGCTSILAHVSSKGATSIVVCASWAISAQCVFSGGTTPQVRPPR